LENEMLLGADIPFSKMSCIISFFSVILVSTCWILLAGITGKRKEKKNNSGTVFTLSRALQLYWETGFKN
jgi:hypothetical protein